MRVPVNDPMPTIKIRTYQEGDMQPIIALWKSSGLIVPWNDSEKDIRRKLDDEPGLFFVAVDGDAVIGTCMAGYDGHRGWVYYLAVSDTYRNQGVGRTLMNAAEEALKAKGCPKLELMVRQSNKGVIEFYEKLGYRQDDVVVLGKRLIQD